MERKNDARSRSGGAQVVCGLGLAIAILVNFSHAALGQGVALRSVSAINESMGGVAVATPIDATGAIHWNPASISGLPSSDMSFGTAIIIPNSTLSSRVGANFGSTDSEPGAVMAPNMAFVRKIKDSPWSYGLGMYAIGGSRVNYPASLTNPIVSPSPGMLGRLSAEVQVYQIAPTLAYQLNEHVSIGLAPTITMAQMIASPLFLGPMNATTHDYSSGVGTRFSWGGGVQGGVYIDAHNGWNYGLSIKSQQWMENFRFNSEDEFGRPRHVEFNLNYPMIISLGTSYTGWKNWVVGCDVKYFDYANTPGFGHNGLNADGSLSGLAWNNTMAMSVGVQRQLGDKLFVRGGYSFNENPIDSAAAQYNVASPLIIQHAVHTGFSYMFDDNWLASMGYVHCFENSVSGPMHAANGAPVPGTSVTSTASADAITFGVSKRF